MSDPSASHTTPAPDTSPYRQVELSASRRRTVATLHFLGLALTRPFPLLVVGLAIVFAIAPTKTGAGLVSSVAGSGDPLQVLAVLGAVLAVIYTFVMVLALIVRAGLGAALATASLSVALVWILANGTVWLVALIAIGAVGVMATQASASLNGGVSYGQTAFMAVAPSASATATYVRPGQTARAQPLAHRIAEARDGHLDTLPAEGTSTIRR